jgi:hypothetical protein
MADVVLAITERALPIFPGLSPKNGREPHEKWAVRKPGYEGSPDRRINICPTLQTMFLRCVVVDAGTIVDGSEGGQENISLRWVQVSARRVGAE